MAEVDQVRLVRCPNCRNLLQEHPRSSIYRCGACDSVLQAKKKVSVNGGGSLEDLGKEEARNDNSYRRKERFAKQRTVQLDANRSLEGWNSSHGNIAEDGPYPSQLERSGDSLWRVNRSRLSSGGASHGAYGSSHPNRPSKTSRLEQDQGLMWKLDELKEEVGMRSLPEKLRAKADCESTRPCGSYHGAVKHFHEPSSYLRRYGFGPGLHPHRCEMNMQDLSFLKNDLCQARTSTSSGPFRPQPCRNGQPASHDHFPKKFMSADQEYQMPHHCQSQSNRPGCSCVHCDSRASPRGPSTTIPGLKGFPQNRMDPSFGHHANPVSFGPSRTNCSTESSTSHLQDEQLNPRHRSSMDSDTDSFDWYRRPTMRVQEPTGNRKRLCHPVADGAPFIVCRNCLELLRLPNVLNWRQQNNPQKLQCGACSTVLFLSIKNKKLRISLQAKKKQASDRNNGNISQQGEKKQASDRDHDFSGNVTNKVDSGSSDRSSALSVTSKVGKEESGNADGSPKSEENIVLPTVQVRNESTGTERSTIDSSPSLVGKEVEALEAIPSHKEDSSSSSDSPALPLRHHEPTIRGSDSHDLLNNASSDDNIDRVGEGNGGEVDEINVVDDKVYSELRSGEKDEMVSTEVDESFQEYLKSELSQEFSNEFSQNVKGTRISNGVHPYLVNVVMNSFKNLSMPSQRKGRTNEDPEVFVNGQPILQHQVAKAEKLAGPISSGNYWYDWQAGFWGVFGQPCLGILPPFIEEFIYPMPASCAAGNTAVFVNGRELHENDLELLSSKGLPTSRDKLYHVDFFGRVVDKDSGEEVANLGKLAPTVEKQNRGFGMRVPGEAL